LRNVHGPARPGGAAAENHAPDAPPSVRGAAGKCHAPRSSVRPVNRELARSSAYGATRPDCGRTRLPAPQVEFSGEPPLRSPASPPWRLTPGQRGGTHRIPPGNPAAARCTLHAARNICNDLHADCTTPICPSRTWCQPPRSANGDFVKAILTAFRPITCCRPPCYLAPHHQARLVDPSCPMWTALSGATTMSSRREGPCRPRYRNTGCETPWNLQDTWLPAF